MHVHAKVHPNKLVMELRMPPSPSLAPELSLPLSLPLPSIWLMAKLEPACMSREAKPPLSLDEEEDAVDPPEM